MDSNIITISQTDVLYHASHLEDFRDLTYSWPSIKLLLSHLRLSNLTGLIFYGITICLV